MATVNLTKGELLFDLTHLMAADGLMMLIIESVNDVMGSQVFKAWMETPIWRPFIPKNDLDEDPQELAIDNFLEIGRMLDCLEFHIQNLSEVIEDGKDIQSLSGRFRLWEDQTMYHDDLEPNDITAAIKLLYAVERVLSLAVPPLGDILRETQKGYDRSVLPWWLRWTIR